MSNIPKHFINYLEDEEYYDTDDGSEIIEDFNEVTEDHYADFPPTDPQYAYQNIATGEVLSASRPTRPPRPKRPNRRPQFSRPHRPAGKPPVIETFEDIGVNNFPPSSGGKNLRFDDIINIINVIETSYYNP